MHKVHIQLHAAHDAIRIQVRRHPAAAETFGVAALERIAVTWRQVSDMELGHWVTGSVGHSGHLSRPGHRVIIFYPVSDASFLGFRKNAQNAKRTFGMLK